MPRIEKTYTQTQDKNNMAKTIKNIQFTEEALEDYNYWVSHDKKIISKIDKLIDNYEETPYTGLGKPDPLKHEYSGAWSAVGYVI